MSVNPSLGAGAKSLQRLRIALLMVCAFPLAVGAAAASAHLQDALPGAAQRAVAGGTADAPRLSGVASLDRTRATVADELHLRLVVRGPIDGTLTLPEFGDKLGEFTVVENLKRERLEGTPPIRIVQVDLRLQPFLPGVRAIGPFVVSASTPGGRTDTATIPAISVTIDSLATPAAELSAPQIRDVLDAPPSEQATSKFVLIAIAAGTGVLAALGASMVLMRNRRPRILAPLDEALERIAAARKEAERRPSAALEQAALALRGMVERTLKTDAMRLTTSQWTAALRGGAPARAALIDTITLLAGRLDVARFAGARTESETSALIDECELVVHRIAREVAAEAQA